MKTSFLRHMFILIILLLMFGSMIERKYPISKKQNVNLTVKVVGYKNTNGKTQIGLYNNEISFPKINKQYKTAIINVNSFVTKYTFSIPVGYYAVALFHDANADGVCNTNFLGIPKEGYDINRIVITGSLSADAIDLIKKSFNQESIFSLYPNLKNKQWLRIDIHRRENMSEKNIEILLKGIKLFQDKGGNIILVLSNALKAAIKKYNLNKFLDELNPDQTMITDHWAKYSQVIEFITSEYCVGIYTDSGGLQEEANILGIKCSTFRYNTDRPETIVEGNSNILVPPISAEFIGKCLEYIYLKQKLDIGNAFVKKIYKKNVGENIAEILKLYKPESPIIEEILEY